MLAPSLYEAMLRSPNPPVTPASCRRVVAETVALRRRDLYFDDLAKPARLGNRGARRTTRISGPRNEGSLYGPCRLSVAS